MKKNLSVFEVAKISETVYFMSMRLHVLQHGNVFTIT
jgi:hypothetical protein